MRLSRLLEGIETCVPVGEADPEIDALVCDSREAREGTLFFCIRGERADGHLFAEEAVRRGAVAVIAEDPLELEVPVLRVPSARLALAKLALRAEGDPQERLRLVGVTGTNGKTTVAFLLSAILRAEGEKVGMLGTIGAWIGGERIADAGLTTPDPLELARTLRKMEEAGCTSVVMEVSSHALEQERVGGLQFSAAAFTNLSRDHLDYHRDMESYFRAKARLFSERRKAEGMAVLNLDDPWAMRLEARPRLRFSREDPGAEIFARSVKTGLEGSVLEVVTPQGQLPIRSPLVGEFNVENLLCAIALAQSLGVSGQAIEQALATSPGAPGRLERVEGSGVSVFVDYAHTDAALRLALQTLRRARPSRLTVVFGCGGDRDRGKRAPMGEAATLADRIIVTSDNPRSENPASIVEDILPGIRSKGHENFTVELDRRRAIELAIATAEPGEAVLIAGKGHEDYQIVGSEKRRFDDREEARRALATIRGQ